MKVKQKKFNKNINMESGWHVDKFKAADEIADEEQKIESSIFRKLARKLQLEYNKRLICDLVNDNIILYAL